MSDIIRNPPKRQQNSVLPNSPIHPPSLDKNPTPGIQNLNEVLKLLSQKPTSRIVENATVLELTPFVGNSMKTKYILPHLNLKEGKTLEDYLLKIRDPIHDEGCRINPEELLIELKKLDKSSASFFKKENNVDLNNIIKQYYECVSNHYTFAPKYSSGIFSQPPKFGTKVRITYFQEPYISPGHKIAGLYEKMYDDDFYEEGFSELRNLLQKYRTKYSQAIQNEKNILSLSNSNLPFINSILAAAGISSNNSATLTLNNTPGQQITTISAADYKVVSELPAGSVNREMFEAAISYSDGFGGQYSSGGNGVLETIYHKGQVVLEHTGGTYCSGATFTIAMKIINKRNLFANKTLEEVKKFQKIWYGSDPSSVIQQQGPALQSMGIGGPISQQEALPGDFAQIWRTNNSGHSTIFVGWIVESGKIVGLKYRSSQGSGAGSGLGNGQEYFSDSGKGSVMRDRLYFSRIKS